MARTLSAPPVRTEFPQAGTPKFFSFGWIKWFQEIHAAVDQVITVLFINGIDVGTF